MTAKLGQANIANALIAFLTQLVSNVGQLNAGAGQGQVKGSAALPLNSQRDASSGFSFDEL